MPINLSGTWKLDSNRSESLLPYLSALGVPDLAAQAASKLVDILNVVQNEDCFTICRMSRFGKDIKAVKFSEELLVKSVNSGTHRISVSKTDTAIILTTYLSNNNGVLTDTRSLEENGKLMHIVLRLHLSDGRQVLINRFFMRSNLTCEELLEQNDTNLSKSPREEEFDSD